ncbi:MAG: putative DNA binding domain-containing protein [Fibromonadaceae bacterium]|jgi:predicted HTH transcriptional regulator|nr:putative DNA binding domain-containing protein [Fibromonadaceae bacterium]
MRDKLTENLLKSIELGEDTYLELKDLRFDEDKVSEPHRNSMADELAAMANTVSGNFILGVDDKSKKITGISKDKLDIVETWIRGICNDLITPPLFCKIHKIAINTENKEHIVIRIEIPRSLFVHQSPSGYLQRIGSSKRQMKPEVLARLFQQRSQARIIRFDEQAVAFASRDCLSKSLWEKFRTPLSPKDDEEFLLKLKLLTQDEEKNIVPSVSGILLATKAPQEFLPNAYIQCVAYSSTERNSAYQFDAKDIFGPLDEQITAAYKFVKSNTKIRAFKNPGRVDIPQYAPQAVFEAIVNAVAHRDYSIQSSKIRIHMFSDRLEIFSPGAIPNTMTVDSLALRQAARNELIASLLARCAVVDFEEIAGYRGFLMDKRGEGVPIILSESQKLSSRLPEYQLIDDSELKLTLFAEGSL